jgi:hypothetical protein
MQFLVTSSLVAIILVDIDSFIVLRAIEVPVIPASVMSFGLAIAANYLLCVVLAFERVRLQPYFASPNRGEGHRSPSC